jgi:hypothetical protein
MIHTHHVDLAISHYTLDSFASCLTYQSCGATHWLSGWKDHSHRRTACRDAKGVTIINHLPKLAKGRSTTVPWVVVQTSGNKSFVKASTHCTTLTYTDDKLGKLANRPSSKVEMLLLAMSSTCGGVRHYGGLGETKERLTPREGRLKASKGRTLRSFPLMNL